MDDDDGWADINIYKTDEREILAPVIRQDASVCVMQNAPTSPSSSTDKTRSGDSRLSFKKFGAGTYLSRFTDIVKNQFRQKKAPVSRRYSIYRNIKPHDSSSVSSDEESSETDVINGASEKRAQDVKNFFTHSLYFLWNVNPQMLLSLELKKVVAQEGQFLFKTGENDDKIYLILNGQVVVSIKNSNGSEYAIQHLGPGKHIVSLVSVLDVVINNATPKLTMQAMAVVPTELMVLNATTLRDKLSTDVSTLFYFIQHIMIRLHRVTFTALHSYLGLSKEFISPDPDPSSRTKTLFTVNRPNWDSPQEVQMAKTKICEKCGIRDDDILDGHITIKSYNENDLIYQQETKVVNVLYVLEGVLLVTQNTPSFSGKQDGNTTLFYAEADEMVGTLGLITGGPSFFTVRCFKEAKVAEIERCHLYRIIKYQPDIICNIGRQISNRLSELLRKIDFAVYWRHFQAGTYLYHSGSIANALLVVLSGRLQAYVLKGDQLVFSREYGRGELIGIRDVLTNSPRSETVMALRSSELAMIPRELVGYLKTEYPLVHSRLLQVLAFAANTEGESNTVLGAILAEHQNLRIPRPITANVNTVALLPGSRTLPINQFARELESALSPIGSTLFLTQDSFDNYQRESCSVRMPQFRQAKYAVYQWLDALEDEYRIVLYVCDNELTTWSRKCLKHADVIFNVCDARDNPDDLGDMEHFVKRHATKVQKVLILLHRINTKYPEKTIEWLNKRPWCNTHLHVRCEDRVFETEKTHRQLLRALEPEPNPHSDISRVARLLTGTAVGVVLGGGGAKGITQLGYLKAMKERAIPVDMVCGTSIGSINGALFARETCANLDKVIETVQTWALSDMSSKWKFFLDVTYPYTSYFEGKGMNKSLQNIFNFRQIEDLWIPYFCVATDLWSQPKLRILASGIIWECVRASISIVPYLPPFPDPETGHYLVDGAYVNNLPADIMYAMGAQTIFACDVGAQSVRPAYQNKDPTRVIKNYGPHLSGWWVLWNNWSWSSNVCEYDIPGADEIQNALQFLTNERLIGIIKNSGMCEYFRPPIDNYRSVDFHKFKELFELGYTTSTKYFRQLEKSNKLRSMHRERDKSASTSSVNPLISADIAMNLAFPGSDSAPYDGFDIWSVANDSQMTIATVSTLPTIREIHIRRAAGSHTSCTTSTESLNSRAVIKEEHDDNKSDRSCPPLGIPSQVHFKK